MEVDIFTTFSYVVDCLVSSQDLQKSSGRISVKSWWEDEETGNGIPNFGVDLGKEADPGISIYGDFSLSYLVKCRDTNSWQ